MILSKIKSIHKLEKKETCYDIQVNEVKRYFSNGILSHNSSMFEAILWCLYGKSLQENVDDVINWNTNKNCKVSVELEIQEALYTIYRYRAHEIHGNALYIFQGDKNLSMKNMADTQNLILDIIQVPFIALTNSILFSSELYSSFLRSSRADRLKVLESVLSLREIGTYYDKVKGIIAELDENLFIHKEKIGKATVGIETIKQTIEQYKEKAKSTLTALKTERSELLLAIETLNNDIKEIDKIDVSNELSNVEKLEKNAITTQRINAEKQKLIDVSTMEVQIMNLLEKIEKLKSIDINKETNIINKYEDLNNKIKELEYSKAYEGPEEIQLEENKQKLQQQTKFLENIDDKSECPVCHQEIKDAIKEELRKNYSKEIKEISDFIPMLEDTIKKNKEKNRIISEKINLLKEQISVPYYTREQLSSAYEKFNTLNNELSILKTRVEESERTNINTSQSISLLRRELFDVDASKYDRKFLTNLSSRKETINKFIQEHTNRINVIDETAKNVYDKTFVEQHEERMKSIQSILSIEEKEVKEINDEKKYYDIFSVLFSNKEAGFKKYFIGKMIGFFNESINFYLPFFFNKEIKVEFDKDLNETINYDDREVNFKSFSAGGKTRIEIATAFALHALSKTFFSSDTNLLVFDEILIKILTKKVSIQ